MTPGGRLASVAAFAAVAAGAVAAALPEALVRVQLPNDVVLYVSAAHSWIHGAGLVSPLLYSYYLGDVSPPVAAFAIHAPVVSVLFAGVLKLGAGLAELGIVHVAWSSLIGASILFLARTSLSLPSAAAVAILVSWSESWGRAATLLLPDATAVGVLLLLLAAAPRGLESVRGALLLAFLTLLAWLTRPNLGAFAPIFLAAACLDRGPRAALRSRALWVYAVVFFLLHRSVVVGTDLVTGLAPYAHYGIMLETLSWEEVPRYQAEYRGALAFASGHLGELLAFAWQNLQRAAVVAFQPANLFVGVVAVPGVLDGLLRRGPGVFRQRLVALAAVGLTAVAVLTGWGFDDRYLLPGFVCGWLAGIVALERWLLRLARARNAPADPARWVPGAVLALALLVVAGAVGPAATQRLRFVAGGGHETQVRLQSGAVWDAPNRTFCGRMDPDALVASPDPYGVLYWCGNAGYLLPPDLDGPERLDRYLDERTPGYLASNDPDLLRLFRASERLELRASRGRAALFRVIEPHPDSRPWRSPGPLAALGPPAGVGRSGP